MKGIYLILNTATGKYYVGETVNLNRRRIGHFSELRRNIHRNDHLQKSFNKYGEESFVFTVIEQNDNFTQEELYNLEAHYVKIYDSFFNGYNLTLGGTGTKGRIFSEEERKIRSVRMTGIGNHFYGKAHTEETKKILAEKSALKIGEKNPFFGKTHVKNWKEIRSELYEEKRKSGWISSNRGVPKPLYAVEAMKKNMPHRKEIIVDGISYMSISECANAIGISRKTIRTRLTNDNFPNYLCKTVEI
ncbi:group I intron endonuclease [Planomicrobium koreense]|uniref:Group I intron endonuclease n=1 Tax=Planococcus koreensis TaxID=112331 RepID=A0A7W8CRP8_9BACL|nr:NUMOD3 domain-containing DNA-binding protein [Planococcus koreensis]MBB5180321.1 group I intron endonuclease [Planococcus koreensis]